MKLEELVCSLELSKRLCELGVKQDSYFYYVDFPGHEYKPLEVSLVKCYSHNTPRYSAFTASELGEILPAWINDFILVILKHQEYFNISYNVGDHCLHEIDDKNLSNGLAKKLIYLLENNLITLDAQQ